MKYLRYALPVAVVVVTGAFGSCGELNRCNPVEIDGHTVCTTLTRAEP